MPTYQSGNYFLLTGNSQSFDLPNRYGDPAGAVFTLDGSNDYLGLNWANDYSLTVYGSYDTIWSDDSNISTLVLHGMHDSFTAYPGGAPATVLGLNVTDTIDIYGYFALPDGTEMANGAHPTATSLVSDGHGGFLQKMYGGGSIDFVDTSKAGILGADVIAGTRY
jgi:hypothetical protein